MKIVCEYPLTSVVAILVKPDKQKIWKAIY